MMKQITAIPTPAAAIPTAELPLEAPAFERAAALDAVGTAVGLAD